MARRRAQPFADVVAQVRVAPVRRSTVSPGRRADTWHDPDGRTYSLVDADLTPARAQVLAADGALVVHDACGCAGAECPLDWLTPDDVHALARTMPDLRPGKDGRADLEHWRTAAGEDLVVATVDVFWGERIPG